MIVVTGGAGFVGSNIVKGLNDRGRADIVLVDDLTDSRKVSNIVDLHVADYFDRHEFQELVAGRSPALDDITSIVHQGASSSTTEPDGRYVMANNYTYSKELLQFAAERSLPFVYASSGSVYGSSVSFEELPPNEVPNNVYGYSKLMVDNFARRLIATAASQIVGIRYFNVYGPREDHKDSMASIVGQLDAEIRDRGTASIFGKSHGYDAGGQRRDFVHVDDVVDVVMWFLDHSEVSGIYNCGTGVSASFLDVAELVVAHRGAGEVRFVDFPDHLTDVYQPNTVAHLGRLRAAGCDHSFMPLDEGVGRYLRWRDERRA